MPNKLPAVIGTTERTKQRCGDGMKKLGVMDILMRGEENALISNELVKLCGYNNKRSLSTEIHALRSSGEIIMSNTCGKNMGYYLPSNDEEIKRFVNSMHSRMKHIKIATISAEQALRGEEECQT